MCNNLGRKAEKIENTKWRSLIQVWILVKKNLLIQRRHPWQSLMQFLIPAMLASLLQIGRSQGKNN